MDAKVIILLVFILFGMIVVYMVANGRVDLTSIFSRVTKSQAQESLGGVKLEIVSPVAKVYYQTKTITLDSISCDNAIDLNETLRITGKNLDGKTLTISVASPHWELILVTYDTNAGYTVEDSGKTIQVEFGDGKEIVLDENDNIWEVNTGDKYHIILHRVDTNVEPFNLPEFVELIFAVGETVMAEVTIVAKPQKSQVQESLGGVKLEIVSPVPGVYYQAPEVTKDFNGDGSDETFPALALIDTVANIKLIKIAGKNLDGKTLTISVASPHWYLYEKTASGDTNSGKTLQFTLSSDGNYYELSGVDELYLVRDETEKEPFSLPEFVELIFAVGETAKTKVTIVAKP